MRFTADQIDLAQELKQLGMPWEPRVGHYVFDAHGICPKSSPFQPGVYFLLNFDCFMRHVGGEDRFREHMVWLPTWHDAREILRAFGREDREVAERLSPAIARGDELTRMYAWIREHVAAHAAGSATTRPSP